MAFLKDVGNRRVLAIDPATHSFAFSVAEKRRGKTKIVANGKISFTKGDTTTERLRKVNAVLPSLLRLHKPTHVVIEETIFIQNPQTTKLLAYIVGGLWAVSLQNGCIVSDVGPTKWKGWLGYKNVSKAEKDEWAKTMTKTEVNKKAKFERKERVRLLVVERLPGFTVADTDITDAVAISMWGVENL